MRIENSGTWQEMLLKCISYYMKTSLCVMCGGYTAIQRRAAETETTGQHYQEHPVAGTCLGWSTCFTIPPRFSSFLLPFSHVLPSSTSGSPIIFFFLNVLPNFIPSLAGNKNSHSLLRLTKTIKDPGWSRSSVYCTVLQDRDVPAWNQFLVSQEDTKHTKAQALGSC